MSDVMPRPSYSLAQLKALEKSPLVRKPSKLPAIEQMIDTPQEHQQRQKTRGAGSGARGDENEHPTAAKRPSLFETRSRQSQSGNNGEIFLGPKNLFASATASAARQSAKVNGLDDKAAGAELTSRPERPMTQERGFRNFDPDRPRERREFPNGHQEFSTRPNYRQRRDSGGETDRTGRYKPRQHNEKDEEGEDRRRSGFGRAAKFEQPWTRNGNGLKDAKDNEPAKEINDRSWRDPPRRKEQDTAGDGAFSFISGVTKTAEPTQDDFLKWKQAMKAGGAGPSAQDAAPSTSEKVVTESTDAATKSGHPPAPPLLDTGKGLFGIYGDSNGDEKKSDSPAGVRVTSGSKPKPSRFQNIFGASKPQETSIETQTPASAPLEKPQASAEDQMGFQRMMEKLRMGNSQSQGPQAEGIGMGPLQATPDADTINMPSQKHSTQRGPSPPQSSANQHPNPFGAPPPPHLQQQQPQRGRPNLPSRDSEFLMNLMRQQQGGPQSPFLEGQIYGQSYNRKSPGFFGEPGPAIPQQEKPRGPPPGLFGNNQAFASNQGVESRLPHGMHAHPPPGPQADQFNRATGTANVSPPLQSMQQLRHIQHQAPGPPLSPHLQGMPPSWPGPYASHHDHGPPPSPPPGFLQPANRSPPPGFFPYGSSGHGPQHPSHQQQQPQPHLQQQQQHRRMPSGPYFNPPPPGFSHPPPQFHQLPPHLQQQQQQQPARGNNDQQAAARRPPSQTLPPGYDAGFPDVARRSGLGAGGAPPPPPQGQYAQYLKQGGGMGAYGGM
ncbi:MAG: hypothetical protein M1828_003380 [Chrysothrix sp. TS-e1954]|nr:MAG: hypothetical protein M1828_003380 [Chrysothrix sp. TS-e1954]